MADATTPHPDQLSSDEITSLRGELLRFFRQHARDLPWRETGDPYAIWVSEIMLQQTRVDTVIPYFRRWLEAFPTATALAQADEAAVLKCWEGLGYYSRARNLHRAAKVVREEHGGRVPATMDDLRSLPGVGPYTAGAVGSIAFGHSVPAVDGNVRRVAARLLDWPDPAGKPLEVTVADWVPEESPGDFNQALMELGATVCTPRNPGCYICPVADICRARAAGTVGERPVPRKKTKVRVEVHAVTVATRWTESGVLELAMRQRPTEGLLGGMWEFPGEIADNEAAARRSVEGSAPAERVVHLEPVPHIFSHLRVTYVPSLVMLNPGGEGVVWLTREEMEGKALPVAQQKIARAALEALEDHARQ